MKNYLKALFLFTFLLLSCSKEKVRLDNLNVVDLEKRVSTSIPSIDKTNYSENIYNHKKRVERLPVICIVFGPGLNRSFLYSSIIRAIEDERLNVHMVTGFGLGMIFGGMYAASENSKKIEWSTYKFFSKNKEKFFTNSWYKNLKNYLYKSIDNKKIQTFSKVFLIPYFNNKTGSVEYLKKGVFGELFEKNGFSEDYKVFPNNVFSISALRKQGADIIIGVDLLGSEINFKKASGFLIGQYGKASSMQNKNDQLFDHIIHIPVQEMKLDEEKNFDLFFQKSYEFTRNELKIIKEKVSNWKSSTL